MGRTCPGLTARRRRHRVRVAAAAATRPTSTATASPVASAGAPTSRKVATEHLPRGERHEGTDGHARRRTARGGQAGRRPGAALTQASDDHAAGEQAREHRDEQDRGREHERQVAGQPTEDGQGRHLAEVAGEGRTTVSEPTLNPWPTA